MPTLLFNGAFVMYSSEQLIESIMYRGRSTAPCELENEDFSPGLLEIFQEVFSIRCWKIEIFQEHGKCLRREPRLEFGSRRSDERLDVCFFHTHASEEVCHLPVEEHF